MGAGQGYGNVCCQQHPTLSQPQSYDLPLRLSEFFTLLHDLLIYGTVHFHTRHVWHPVLGEAACAQQHGIPCRWQDIQLFSYTNHSLCFKKRTSLTLVYILIRSCVSTHIIALFVYGNGHVCITATPLGGSFRIALYIRQVLIFGRRGSRDPCVLDYDICFLLYIPYGPDSGLWDFFPYGLTAAYYCMLAWSTSDSKFIFFVTKDEQQLEFSDISDILPPLSKCGKYCCVYNVWIPAAKY